jgi:hypothetical protein
MPNRNRWIVAGATLIVLGSLLLVDLAFQGLAWRALYNITGEESIPGQVVGFKDWAGRWFRAQPRTANMTPVNHAGVHPMGINVFLEQEVEPEKRERIVQMVSDAGFTWLRQEFPWEDIEIHGPGDFTDRRNDRDGDGEITEADIISAWDKYDHIVDTVEAGGLNMMVRLSNPPDWTHADPNSGDKGPPDNLEDYINYAVAVAERYQGRITHYQIWNEPNIFPEWGNRDVNAIDYTEMLCRTYDALKAVDEDIVVVSGAIAPTVSMSYRDLNDFIYLEQMFAAGAADCFDVMSMQGYGLNSGPTDRRLRPTTINFNRVLYIRDLLVQHGHPEKAIWISEAAWNPVPPDVPDISGREIYGVVTEEQAARYMVQAYERQQREWPYTGVMFYWFFKRASDAERNQSWYYFRMAEPDFTPLPVYDAIKQYSDNLTPTLYGGVHQAEHWAIRLPDDAVLTEASGAEFDEAMLTDDLSFIARGTLVAVRWQGGEAITVLRDGEPVQTLTDADAPSDPDGWHEVRTRLGWMAGTHEISVRAEGAPVLIDSVTVFNTPVRDALPLVAIVVLVVGPFVMGIYLLRRVRSSRARNKKRAASPLPVFLDLPVPVFQTPAPACRKQRVECVGEFLRQGGLLHGGICADGRHIACVRHARVGAVHHHRD